MLAPNSRGSRREGALPSHPVPIKIKHGRTSVGVPASPPDPPPQRRFSFPNKCSLAQDRTHSRQILTPAARNPQFAAASQESGSEMVLQRKGDAHPVGRVPECCLEGRKEEGEELSPPDLRTTGGADRISARRQITSRSLWRLFVFSEILTCKNRQINSSFRETTESIFSSYFFFPPFFRPQKGQPCRSCLIAVPSVARIPAKGGPDKGKMTGLCGLLKG